MIRLRLQMLRPASSTKCSWKRRTSSAVAVSGDRFKNAANRLQLWIWLRCEWGPSLRAVMSSIMRRRSGLMVVSIVTGSSFLSEVDDAADQEGVPRPVTRFLLLPPLPQATLPRSGYRVSDFVRWHMAAVGTISPCCPLVGVYRPLAIRLSSTFGFDAASHFRARAALA